MNRLSTVQSFRVFGIHDDGDRGLGVQYLGKGGKPEDIIPEGEILMYYGGEVLTKGVQFEDAVTARGRNPYGFLIMECGGDESWISMFIAGVTRKCLATRINHSCVPNATAYPCWTIDGVQRLAIASRTRIRPKEYLSIDYKWEYTEGYPPTVCNCKALGCRGWIETGVPSNYVLPSERGVTAVREIPDRDGGKK